MFEGGCPIFARTGNLREGMKTGGGPRLVPGGFVKGFVGFVIAAEVAQTHSEMVIGLAVVGIGIAAREPFDGAAEIWLGFDELAAAQMRQAERDVATRI